MKSIEETAVEEIASQRAEAAERIPKGIDEALVREKMRAGLTRAQAVEVIERQMAYDASQVPKAPKKASESSKASKATKQPEKTSEPAKSSKATKQTEETPDPSKS